MSSGRRSGGAPAARAAPGAERAGRGAPGRARVSRAEREPEMLRAAAEVFGEHGYNGASMDEIAARVGVTKPLLYSYFDSKQGLFAACGEAAAVLLRERVSAAAGRHDLAPDRRLWCGLLSVFEFIGENRQLWFVFIPPPGGASPAGAGEVGARGRHAMNELLGELLTGTAVGEGVAPQAAELAAPLAHALTGSVLATAERWHEHPDEPVELQALRVMNFAWLGFEQLLAGKLWLPDG